MTDLLIHIGEGGSDVCKTSTDDFASRRRRIVGSGGDRSAIWFDLGRIGLVERQEAIFFFEAFRRSLRWAAMQR